MKLTVRGRLTLVYGGLFVLAGLVLLGATYVLTAHQPTTMVAGATFDVSGPPPGAAALDRIASDARTSALHSMAGQGAIVLIVVSAATIALGWLIAGRMLQPLHRITETARRIAEAPAADRGLHERIALTGPRDEIKELADTFDVMLARLDRSFDGQRRFIASASHELRTPLTLNRTLLEVALTREDASEEVRHLGTTLLAINERHGRLIDGLLLLAQSEREVDERSYVDLADIVEHVAVPAAGLKMVTEPNEATVAGNPVLLERLVQNLVENGVRHNRPADGWICVRTQASPDGWVHLEVSNSGPVVPRYEVPGLFEPFRRYGTERLHGPGAGLGLSIVRAVARAHGGDVRAVARDEGGLIVTVTLPRAG
jgi:signal transduction histidine kinase